MTSIPCHICGQEAVERCYTCGQLFCEKHGKENCDRCTTAIAPGDRRPDRVSSLLLSTSTRPAWWRPQRAEDFEPPACYICQGLAPRSCLRCQEKYCAEHGSSSGLCQPCARSAWWGTIIISVLFTILGALMFLALAWQYRPTP